MRLRIVGNHVCLCRGAGFPPSLLNLIFSSTKKLTVAGAQRPEGRAEVYFFVLQASGQPPKITGCSGNVAERNGSGSR